MTIANVILVHNNPAQLKRLLERLNADHIKTFIHLDRKCAIDDFFFLKRMPNVELIKRRHNVKWGGFSMVEAILDSFKEVLGFEEPFDYVNLLSGQDYPIKSLSEFTAFLNMNPKHSFLEFHTGDHDWIKEARYRISRYYFTDYKFKGSTFLESVVNFLFPSKKLPIDFEIIGHSGWFTIDHESAAYVVQFFNKNKSFIRKFRFSWGSDEFLIQSILYNSPLKDKIINNNLRYIDWSEGKASPKILTVKDIEKLNESNSFFARKFDLHKDYEILDILDRKIGYSGR